MNWLQAPIVLIGLVVVAAGCSGEKAEEAADAIRTRIADESQAATAVPQATEPDAPGAGPAVTEAAAPLATEAPPPESTDALPPEPEEPPEQQSPDGEEVADPTTIDDDGLPWPWIVLGAVMLLFMVVLAGWLRARRSGRRAEEASWRGKALESYAKGAALHDALAVQTSDISRSGATADLHQRWREAERRMNDLAVDLHTLEATPPDSDSARAVQGLLAAMAALRSSAQSDVSVRTQESPDVQQIEESAALLRRRLAEFNESLGAFRAAN